MHPYRALRRLLSRASEDWQDAVEGLFRQPSRAPRPRPLRVMRLERRRVLSADFSLSASSLVLSGFDGADGDTLAITQQGDAYLFTTEDGWDTPEGEPLPAGVSVEGETLTVARGLLDSLPGGLVVEGSNHSPLDVRLGNADFSESAGPVSLIAPTTIGGQPLALFTAPAAGLRLASASAGTMVTSINVAGNLEVVANGTITDAPGTQIIVSGNARFTSRAFSPAGDFDGSGVVDNNDHALWAAAYGVQSGASKYDGDANGDGRVDAADYTLWRDTLGESGLGGITLADEVGDRLIVGGSVTFDASEAAGSHAIDIGAGGQTEFGSISAYGTNITIVEDASLADTVVGGPTTVLNTIEAYNFNLTSYGRIEAGAGSSIRVENNATLTSLYATYETDFSGDGKIDQADYDIWLANSMVTTGATQEQGDANSDGAVDQADYTLWRDAADLYATFGSNAAAELAARGGIDVGAGALFEAGGLVTLVARDGATAADAFDITVGDGATANFGSFSADGAIVTLYEDGGTFKPQRDGSQAGTLLDGVEAQQLLVVSAGRITDTAESLINVAADATFVVSSVALIADSAATPNQAIVLADSTADRNQLLVEGVATFIVEPAATTDPLYDGPKGIDVGVLPSGETALAAFRAGSLRFSAPGATVRIAEDDGTMLAGWTAVSQGFEAIVATPVESTAQTLELYSSGAIEDASNSVLTVTGRAADGTRLFDPTASSVFVASGKIDLADEGTSNQLSIDGLATLFIRVSATIDLGITTLNAGLPGDGTAAEALFNAGSLRFAGTGRGSTNVRIAEDAGPDLGPASLAAVGTNLASWTNASISSLGGVQGSTANRASQTAILSAGPITDDADAVSILGNTTLVVTPGATTSGGFAIRLADSGAGNQFNASNLTIVVPTSTGATPSGSRGVDLGVTAAGAAANSTLFVGNLRFNAPGESVRAAVDTDVAIGDWRVGALSPLITGTAPVANQAETLELGASRISDDPGASTEIAGDATFVAFSNINLADGAAPNSLIVGDLATFVGTSFIGVDNFGAAAAATFTAGRLRFAKADARVYIAEDDATVIAGWPSEGVSPLVTSAPTANVAVSLELTSAGSITDQADAAIDLSVNATFVAADTITLADSGVPNRLTVGDFATFVTGANKSLDVGVAANGAPAAATFTAGQLRFSAPKGVARIAEDNDTLLTSWTVGGVAPNVPTPTPTTNNAQTLELYSAGSIGDLPSSVTQIVTNATFVAQQSIALATSPSQSTLTVGQRATFVAGYDRSIVVGVDATTGTASPSQFNAGALRYFAPSGIVRIAEDSATVVDGWPMGSTPAIVAAPVPMANESSTLVLSSAGSITDSPDAVILVTGRNSAGVRVYNPNSTATFVAANEIVLADGAVDNKLIVDGQATLIAGIAGAARISVGVAPGAVPAAAEFIAGSVRFSAPGRVVSLAEDAAATFKTVTYAETPGTHLSGWGSVAPIVASPPSLSEALTLELSSAGPITDAADAVLRITDDATFVVTTAAASSDAIVLADGAVTNKLVVGDLATFIVPMNANVKVGVTSANAPASAEFLAGRLRFSAPGGVVRIAEDHSATIGAPITASPGTVLAGWAPGSVSSLVTTGVPVSSRAQTLDLLSSGRITDEAIAVIEIAGPATFRVNDITTITASTAIELANEGSANKLLVGGLAAFSIDLGPMGTNNKGIDVGVLASGMPAEALFDAGSLSFYAPGGMVRIAEDAGTVLGAASSNAQDLRLLSAEGISDVDGASTLVTRSAELNARNGLADVVLGDGPATFSMGTPDLFNAEQYLAIDAANVSVQADSAVNIHTSGGPLGNLTSDADFSGVYFLTATGSVTQVTDQAAPVPLKAAKISVASEQAVLLRLLELTTDDGAPNLQIKAGGSASLSQALVGGGTVVDKFEGSEVPWEFNPKFAPVVVSVDNAIDGSRPPQLPRDPNPKNDLAEVDPGFEDLLQSTDPRVNARLYEVLDDGMYADSAPTSGGANVLDANYSAIVVVRGEAVIGDVADPNGGSGRVEEAAGAAAGFVVAGTGNGFLRTTGGGDLTFTNAGRESDSFLDAEVVNMAGGVFTAIAAGTLKIDTENADQQQAGAVPGYRTTRLTSATGTVTSVGGLALGADLGSAEALAVGPRAILDPSTEVANAATTGLVRADQNFEQRLTLAVGSRGENNVLVEVEWADVANRRSNSDANIYDIRDPDRPVNEVVSTTPGSAPYADLTQAPVSAIESVSSDPLVTQYKYQQLDNEFRVGTLRHVYSREFVPANPAQNTLPTTVRVYNDPAINLYDHAEAPQGDPQLARDLNSASFVIAPRIITLPEPGYTLVSAPEAPREYEPAPAPVARTEPTSTPQQTQADVGRAVVSSTAEDVTYGRVNEDGDWIVDIPGESWPQVRENTEGDFLREVRDKIDEGPYSEGRYVIKVVTPRSEQVLEEWVKGDALDAQDADATPVAEPGLLLETPPAEGELRDGAPEIEKLNAPAEAPPILPEAQPLSARQFDSASPERSRPSEAANAAFAAMAAVGVWRRRLDEGGPFRLDADGVAFTRVKRRRRKRID